MAEMTLAAGTSVDDLDPGQLDLLERQIATRYMKIVPWGAVVWGLGNCVAFYSLLPLVILEVIPLWLGFPLACIGVAACYLPSHEAQHNIIGARGSSLRWLNELVGHVSTLPMVAPYRVLRATHMQHHANCNDPELDPDYNVHASSDLAYLSKALLGRLAGRREDLYSKALQRTGQANFLLDGLIYQIVFVVALFALAWSGYAIEAALLLWLPKHIGMMYISYYLSWAPHHPGVEQGRYMDTRAFRSRLGNILSMGMQYHIVHHLYPRIPLSLTPKAYWELRPILERRGCDLGRL